MEKMSVLIVDNSPGVRRELESVLAEQCLFDTFEAAATPGEALAIGRSLRPDLIIYDLPLTGSLDAETISELRAFLPESGIIALSLYETYRKPALTAGADEFILKTAPRTSLLEAVDRVCPSRQPG
jgi:DNA-binding NarL/FixJ family response regulator